MTAFIHSIILGIVQGATEFLPVSSSGHLILARTLLGINTEHGLAFDAVLQLGTVVAALLYFRVEIWKLIRGATPTDRMLRLGIIIGTIPALVLGLLLKDFMETVFRSAPLVACTLIAGSMLFIIAERAATQRLTTPTLTQSWWIGVFQSLALVPGISRSGATISGGLLLGLTRETATRFSFLLSLPIITGSGLLQAYDLTKAPSLEFSLTQLIVGFLVSAIVGYASIRWLLTYLKHHSLMAFVWYRCALALIILLVSLALPR